ncbi:MAG: N-acetylmuramoyl-L-alanine amidase [Acidobacteriaceae bacterium]|nr:N-acetylmuramoyl-L-alanine amidase [Acidobacteriaceae bacterium]
MVRVTIELDGDVTFRDERVENPARVYVDLPSTRPVDALKERTLRFDGDTAAVREVRVGSHPNETTRVVLDAGNVSSYTVYPLYNPPRLVIDCLQTPALVAKTTAKPAAPPPPVITPLVGLSATRIGSGVGALAVIVPGANMNMDAPIATTAAAAPSHVPATVLPNASMSPHNTVGGFSIARQLGMGVSRIVIDPGHGGHDPGTKDGDTSEADLVLDVALRLEKLLRAVPGLEIVLTRRSDTYVSLQERTAIANAENADLFLSIHANASNTPSVHGVETYFLNFAVNQSAAAVAARENAASGQNMAELPDVVKTIALNNKVDESRDFATYVQRALVNQLRPANKTLRDLGVKQAPFVVLIGASMPSVLTEISFLTNAQEARLLKSNAYRQRIAVALFDAVKNYQTSLASEPIARAR